jgi:GAF domain-containing protein
MNIKQKSTDREQDKTSAVKNPKWLRGLSSLVDSHPSVQDIGERRRAQLLNIITLILSATFLLALLAAPDAVGTFIFLLLLSLAAFILGKTKYYKIGAGLFAFGFLSSAYIPLLMGTASGFVSSVTSIVPIALLVASVLLGQREFLFIAIVATLATFLAPYYSTIPTTDVTRSGGVVLAIGAILYGINAFRANVERARLKEVQDVNRELTEIQIGLEQRITDRTKALATTSEVSRRLSTILDRKKLVTEVVNQVNTAFGYYHTQIYFYDNAGENLVMAGGSGEAGKLMLAQFHKVMKGRGLVGRAAESNKPVLVSDTTKNPEWLPNPLLPDTKSETAIPISIGDEVLGVLDIQQNVKDGLQQKDVDTLQSIANQVAIALQNIQSTEIVAKRATELQTVATISTAAATISDIQKMLESVVHLTQRGFGLYHAHVFVYNEDTAILKIAACGWKAGDEHEGTHGTAAIPLAQEQSLVARAGRTRQAVIVNDVHNEPGWLPNPLLPDTASELAVPLIVGDQLLGVLDVQSERLNAFTNEDANIQTTLASQVATALQNARSFSQSQRQAERETSVNLITQKIQNTTTVEAALKIAARELGHALGKVASVKLEPDNGQEDHKNLVKEGAS